MPQIFIFGGRFEIRVTNPDGFAQREAFNPELPVGPGLHWGSLCLPVRQEAPSIGPNIIKSMSFCRYFKMKLTFIPRAVSCSCLQ